MMRQAGKVKKAGAILITAVLAAMLSLQTVAAALADGEKASLTIQAVSEGNKISGVEWSVYQIARMPQDGEFVLTDAFAASGLDIDSLNESTQSDMQRSAKNLLKYAKEQQIEAAAAKTTDQDGTARIQNLDRGLYLVYQTGTAGASWVVESTPFFIALPTMEDIDGKRVMKYDVTAFPKLEIAEPPTTEPETEETKPEESTSEETKPEESTSEETKPEDSTPEETKPEESTSGESRPEESTQAETATSGGSSGGNSGGGSSDRDRGGSSDRTIINDPEVPLASFPTSPDTPALEILEDNPVPLAALPKLGDMGTGGALAGLLLSLTAAAAALTGFRKIGESEKNDE